MRNNESAYIKEIKLSDCNCIEFGAGGYQALMAVNESANVIKLKDIKRNLNVLNEPKGKFGFEALKKFPVLFGLPILFPPNRIEDGKFKVGKRSYQLPINEINRNNYIHGFIKNQKFTITRKEIISNNEVELEATFYFNKEHKFYEYFPHECEFKIIYNLSNKGLKQTVRITNLSNEKMPLGLGFHTAFNVPFNEEGKIEDYRIMASIDKRWEQDERLLPTGTLLSLTEAEEKYHTKGISPIEYEIESHYTLKNMNLDGKNINGAIIEDKSKGIRVIYEMGQAYKHIVIWNGMIESKFLCIEPQSWVINAPNVNLDDNITGFKILEPNETWIGECNIYVEDTMSLKSR